MAVSYDNTPLDLSTLFRAIVLNVETNITSEASLSIDRVNYFCETWVELCTRLKRQDAEWSNAKYPLIALIRNFEESITEGDESITGLFTFVICAKTTKDMLSEDRIESNFNNIITPIYLELLEQIVNNQHILGYFNPYPKHKAFKSFNLGTDAGNKSGLMLPDFVDAMIVSDLELRINRPRTFGFIYGSNRSLAYLNNVSFISISYSAKKLSVKLESHEYYNPIAHTLDYKVFFSHDSSLIPIDVGATYTKSITSVSKGMYYGYVQCNDGRSISKLGFFYYINDSGEVVKYSTLVMFKLQNFTTTGFTAPDYPFEAVIQHSASVESILAASVTEDFYGEQYSETHPTPVADIDNTTVTCTNKDTNYKSISFPVTIDSPGNTTTVIESISYYQTN